MDISAIGTQYLNSSYVPFSAPDSSELYSGESASFEEILRKAQNSQNPSSPASPASKSASIDKNDKLYELCMELETFLIKNLVKGMRNTVQKTKLIDTGFAGEMYEDMLYDEYSKNFAKNANFGLAEMAYRELAGIR